MITRDNSLLVRVKMSYLNCSVADREVTEEVRIRHNADFETGVYIKKYFHSRDLFEISKVCGKIDRIKKRYTLPFIDGNIRLLPSKAFDAFTKELQEAILELESAVAFKVEEYDVLKERVKKRMNGLYKESEFPSKEKFQNCFKAKVTYLPIPEGDDFRVGDLEIVNNLKSSFQEEMDAQTAAAKAALWGKFKDVIGIFYKRLQSADKGFRKELVENIADITKLAKVLNMDEDKNLEDFRAEVESKLTGFDSADLNSDKDFKEAKELEAKELLEKLESYI
jgi:hypothetical protein